MKKKIILLTFILIIFFIIFNYKVFLGNYYFLGANNNYLANNFTGALDGYNDSLKYLSGSKIDFNKGNTYYKIGENEKNINKKINNFKESLDLYNNILEKDLNNKKQENSDTRYNYEFVKKKLEELQEQEEQKQEEQEDNEQENEQEQEKQEKGEQEQNQAGDEEKSDEEKNSETVQNEDGDIQELEDKLSQFELSFEELKQIEDYVEKLKQEEKYNRKYLNNVKPISNNPFFDSLFDRGGEKDW